MSELFLIMEDHPRSLFVNRQLMLKLRFDRFFQFKDIVVVTFNKFGLKFTLQKCCFGVFSCPYRNLQKALPSIRNRVYIVR